LFIDEIHGREGAKAKANRLIKSNQITNNSSEINRISHTPIKSNQTDNQNIPDLHISVISSVQVGVPAVRGEPIDGRLSRERDRVAGWIAVGVAIRPIRRPPLRFQPPKLMQPVAQRRRPVDWPG
jgi:hypothetical protein